MTDYERSPKSPHRSYKHPRDRTSDWVSRLPPKHAAQFLDPTMPPSDTESAVYSSDSDAESSRSVPPRFVLRFPDGREERVSDSHYSNPNASLRDVRSRVASGPVNGYGPHSSHHHPRSMSMHSSGGHPRGSGPLFRPHSSNANFRPQEDIRILPTRSMTPATAGYINSRPVPVHHPRSSSVMAPSPRRAYDRDLSEAPHHGPSDEWAMKHGPPQSIKFSHSHPPSKYDARDYPSGGYRPRSSSKLSRQSVIGSPSSQMSLLTKENTIANSHTRTMARGGIIEDNWSLIDEDEEWEKEQQRAAAYRRGRTSSSSSGSPPLTYSRSRTTSSSSRSGFLPPGPKFSGPEKFGPPPANSTGAGSMKRPFFSRFFRTGSDKNLSVISSPPNRLHRRHSVSGSRR